MSKNLSELSFRKGIEENLFESMGIAARKEGSPGKDDLNHLAQEFLIGKSSVYGAASFYDFLKEGNKGKEVYVCNGTACVCAGKQNQVQNALQHHFQAEQIGHMTCLGRCHENAAFHYQGKNYSGSAFERLDTIIDQNDPGHDTYNVGQLGPALLTAPFSGLENIYTVLKSALQNGREWALGEIKTSQIRGRGGAGFPMGFKLESCQQAKSEVKFIVCNADEGDPGAYSDRYLLEQQAHLVLSGMLVAGFITGAEWGILYIRAEYPEAVIQVQKAINEVREAGYLGRQILGSNFSFDLKVIQAQGAYICGEETALINSIEGQRPEVRTRPPFPTQAGLFNKPTVVNNVETLAAIPAILRLGGAYYASLGTEKSKGTKLVSLDSFFRKPGIYEVEMGTPLTRVFEELGGGFRQAIKAIQIGGPLGGVVPVSKIKDLTLDYESFSQQGFLLGHASAVCIPQEFPMIDFLEHLMDFAQYESCGKCFPCRLGTKRGHEMLKAAKEGQATIARELFDDLLNTLQQGSLCAHGGGIPLPVRNALQYFQEELKPYFHS
ncbi:MAG: NADH-ubiquinone oxidoreductase-F iron-sulfur binding region domain-containing protein [Bacteroidia bacterium]